MAMRRSMKKAMKKAMKKSMKKAMKSMRRRKAMKVSKIAKGYKRRSGANRAVFSGRKEKTTGGLSKSNLTKNKHGKIVSKKQSAAASKKLGKWLKAVAAARKALGIVTLRGFWCA